jgi:hypothetical protein
MVSDGLNFARSFSGNCNRAKPSSIARLLQSVRSFELEARIGIPDPPISAMTEWQTDTVIKLLSQWLVPTSPVDAAAVATVLLYTLPPWNFEAAVLVSG